MMMMTFFMGAECRSPAVVMRRAPGTVSRAEASG